jgi:citrate synthase
MDTGYSTVRNLLYIVLVLVVLAVLSNFYVASQLSRNSDELASLRLYLQKQMMGTVLTQAEELQKRMDALNQSAAGIDAKMKKAQDEMDAKLKKAQDDFVARMQVELPRIMDNYIKQRAPLVQRQLEQRGVPLPKP